MWCRIQEQDEEETCAELEETFGRGFGGVRRPAPSESIDAPDKAQHHSIFHCGGRFCRKAEIPS